MKKNYIHVCVVLDASGSMGVVENDVKGTFNTFIAEQREEPGKTVLDVYQFSDETTRIVRSADLSTFENDLMRNYRCSGMTALNDAVCQAIDEIGAEFAALPESERPEQILVAILTDGEENASRRFTTADVKERIDRQTNVYSWKFVFLAANIDATETGAALGLAADDCVAFECSEEGLGDVCACFSERLAAMRAPDADAE
ncbi:MAG: VWA domain-containing protein [Thermoguttaceae bacterium]|nr:VWA domain-containing protein [Thermoguttaceae bacterium]